MAVSNVAALGRNRWAVLCALAVSGCGGAVATEPERDQPTAVSEARSRRWKPAPAPSPTPTPAPAPTPTPTPASAGAGKLLWQVALDGPYSMVRPAVGTDGTVYAVDAYSNLYAVAPGGALRWKVAGAGSKGLAAGVDGTIYVGSEAAVRAYAPDGTLRWTFAQSPRAFIFLGLSLGPDGNLYAVGTHGMGVFSLTPAGALRWAVPEPYDRPIVDYGEIVFASSGGKTQLAFYANAHVRSLDLAGNQAFTVGGGSQPAAGPDGTFRLTDRSYGLDGLLRWDSALGSGGAPAVGPDGTSFFVFLAGELDAVDATGRTRFVAPSADWLGDPTVHPAGGLVLLGSLSAADGSGALQARSPADGAVLWRLALPAGQHVDTRPGFSADGTTAYLVTAQSALPQAAWLTAVSVR